MPPISLRAHYDGHSIQLDEPFNLPANARLLVTVLPAEESDEDEQWARLAKEALARVWRTRT
jgi:hypothetical protein